MKTGSKNSLILQPIPTASEYGYPIDGIIFDFDGVIVDTERYHYHAWKHAAATVGAKLSWEDYLPLKSTERSHILDAIQHLAGKPLNSSLREQVINAKVTHFDQIIGQLSERSIIPGVRQFLEYLSSRQTKMAVASSSTTARKIAEEFQLDGYFHVIIDANSKLPKKPAPDLFLAAAAALSCSAKRCLVFEDSLAGIDAAVNAGMYVVAVGGIRSEKAIAHIMDFQDVYALFTQTDEN